MQVVNNKNINFIGYRIRQVRKRLGLNQIDFGKYLELSQVRISELEKEASEIKEVFLSTIEHKFNVNSDWLRNGEGEMGNISLPEERERFKPVFIGTRLQEIINVKKTNILKLAETCNIKDEHAVELLQNKRMADRYVIDRVSKGMDTSTIWLATGKGTMDQADNLQACETLATYNTSPFDADVEPEHELEPDRLKRILSLAAEVLASRSHYAISLEMNIKSFYTGLNSERREKSLNSRMAAVEETLKRLTHGGEEMLDFPESGRSSNLPDKE